MYQKIVEKSPKKVRFKRSKDVADATERSVTPPPQEESSEETEAKYASPYVSKPPNGYDALYSHSHGKSLEIPTRSPGGTEKKRRRHEGQCHSYLKVDGATYHEGKIPKTPEKQVHTVVVKSINLSRRFEEDKRIFLQEHKALDANHLCFSKEELQNTLDLILKIYLACQNRQDYIDDLNQRIRDKEFLNLFQMKIVYDQSTATHFPYELARLRSDISIEDVKSILFDQLRRLTVEADQDFYLFQNSDQGFTAHAKETVKFAKACMKKIAEFCRFFTEDEKIDFLKELNEQKFYHLNQLLSLYLDDCTHYDIARAGSGVCYQRVSLLDITAFPEGNMRKTFFYTPLISQAHTPTRTVIDEKTIETYDENGVLRSRETRKVTTTQQRTLFFQRSTEYNPEGADNDLDRLIPSERK